MRRSSARSRSSNGYDDPAWHRGHALQRSGGDGDSSRQVTKILLSAWRRTERKLVSPYPFEWPVVCYLGESEVRADKGLTEHVIGRLREPGAQQHPARAGGSRRPDADIADLLRADGGGGRCAGEQVETIGGRTTTTLATHLRIYRVGRWDAHPRLLVCVCQDTSHGTSLRRRTRCPRRRTRTACRYSPTKAPSSPSAREPPKVPSLLCDHSRRSCGR